MVPNHFFFANPQTLSRYIKRYITLPEDSSDLICKKLCEAIDSFVSNEKNTNKLSNLSKEIKQDSSIDNDTWYQCLRATKDYLRSRDFQCPQKYVTRSWVWGQVKQVKESALLHPLYRIIEDEMEQLAAPMTSFSFILYVYQNVTSGLTRAIDNPMQTLVFAITLQSLLVPVNARNVTSTAFGDKQSHEDTLASITTVSSKLPNFVDQIPYQYHIISQRQNISMDKVKYFFLVSPGTYIPRYDVNFIQNMGTGQDYVLQKDVLSLTYIECKDLGLESTYRCLGWDWDVWTDTVKKLHDSEALKRSLDLLAIYVEDRLATLKLDLDYSVLGILAYSTQYYATSYNIEKEKNALLKLIVRVNEGIKKFPELDELNLAFNLDNIITLYTSIKENFFIHSTLKKLVFEWSEWLRKIDIIKEYTPKLGYLVTAENVIKQRNKSMMTTLNSLNEARLNESKKIRNNKFFIFLPHQQILPNRVTIEEGLTTISADDPQFQLKEYLDDKDHAILMPKEQRRI